MMKHAEQPIEKIAQEVLRAKLGAWGFASATVDAGIDDLGDRSLFITAHFAAGSPSVPGKELSEALAELRVRIRDAGEARFPYFALEVARARA